MMPISSALDFVVNTTTAGAQNEPHLAPLSDGRFIATWQSSEGGNYDIRARLFNASGTASGPDFIVNTATVNDQYSPVVTSLADGRIVFAWHTFGGGPSDVSARIFNADGSPFGPDFTANSIASGSQYDEAIAPLADGRFVVSWLTYDGTQSDIYAGVFNADGTPSVADFIVNTTLLGSQENPSMASLAGGGFVLVWETDEGGARDIRARVFNNDGMAIGADFMVNSTTIDTQLRPSVAALAGGGFVVTWDSATGSEQDIRARIFKAGGTAAALDFAVNTTIAGGQYNAAVAALPDGRFYITWDSYEAGQTDIRARLFNADGSAAGADFIVGTTTAGDQFLPVVTMLADGRLVSSWYSSEGGQFDIRATILDPNVFEGTVATDTWIGGAVDEKMFGYAGDDTFFGAAGNDYLNGGDNADSLVGGRGNDTLDGGNSVDRLIGNAGDDRLLGGRGADILNGGKGNDKFVYLSPADGGDSILKFAAGDKLVFDNAGFVAGKVGTLKTKFFVSSTSNKALDANDHFIFRTGDDTLWYDADGKGGAASVLIADLTNNFDVRAGDILII